MGFERGRVLASYHTTTCITRWIEMFQHGCYKTGSYEGFEHAVKLGLKGSMTATNPRITLYTVSYFTLPCCAGRSSIPRQRTGIIPAGQDHGLEKPR